MSNSDIPVSAPDDPQGTTTRAGAPGERTSPPKPPLAFRVGVIGHRPDRLAAADLSHLSGVLRTVLSVVHSQVLKFRQEHSWLFDNSPPVLRAISPLAEGADRLFAEQALEVGFELCAVMPFPQNEYEQTFGLEEDSVHRFQKLLSRACSRFELDGCQSDAPLAYGVAGRTVLNQSDLLVVVWDGERQNKRGGTEETLDDARRQGIPIVWVDAHAPHHWQVIDPATSHEAAPGGAGRLSPSQGDAAQPLADRVRAALDLPGQAAHGAHHESEDRRRGLKQFYAERRPRWSLAVVWKAFRDVVGDGRFPKIEFRVPPFGTAVQGEWSNGADTPADRIADWLRPFYAWPDKLAVIYSNRYRSSFVLAFLLAAFAVGMALLPTGLRLPAHHPAETICIALELLAIIVILCLVIVGRRFRWHERWINYRLAAEMLRHLRLVAPLGGRRAFPQIPAQWAVYGQPGSTWMAWYVRALERAVGLETVVVTNDYLESSLTQLHRLIESQTRFHRIAAARSRRIEKSLHRLEIALLVVTIASCCLHLLPGVWHRVHLPDWLPPLLTFFCGYFPATGAALAGILNQGEFRRIEMRSASMSEQLQVLDNEVDPLRLRIKASGAPEQFSIRVAALANDAARLLLNEVLDWRVVFLDRPFEQPPG